MSELYKKQEDLLIKYNKFYKNKKKLNLYNYCSLGSESLGALKFKSKIDNGKYFISFLKEHFREIYGLGLITKIKVLKNNDPKNYENIILNWAFKKDFKNFFFDKYFNINSKNYKKILWLIVYMSNEKPKKFPKNTFVIQVKKNKYFNFFYFISNIIYVMKFSKLPFFSKIFNLSQQIFLSTFLEKTFIDYKNYKNIKQLFLPYEAQLFQKKIIFNLKKKFQKLKIIGYDHTAPQPLPINQFYDKYSPDLLLVGSKNKFKLNHRYLNWPKKKMRVIKSLRFKLDKKEFKGKVLLPYVIKDKQNYLKNIIELMEKLNLKKIKNSSIKIHPACKKKKNHIKFVQQICKLKNVNYKKNLKKRGVNNFVIFLGQTTAIPLAIESGLKTFNICMEPLFDVYSSKLWTGIICKPINNYIYQYNIKNKGSLIWIDSKRNKFQNITNNI